MKLRVLNLEFPYRFSTPCGVAALALGAGSAAMGLMSSAINADSQASTNKKSMDFQREENEKNRLFSSTEAEKQRRWQTEEWLRQYDMQKSEWYKQLEAENANSKDLFNYEAEYNLPSNQVRRLSAAGLNPAAVLGSQGSSGMVAASSGNMTGSQSPQPPSGGSVSGASASMSPSGAPNITAPQIDLSGLGSFLRDSVSAFSESAQLRPKIEQIYAQIDNIIQDTISTQLKNEYQKGLNFILGATKDVKVRQAYLDIATSYADVKLKEALGKEADASAVQKSTEAFLNLAKQKLTKEQYLQAVFTTTHQLETWNNDQKLKNSQAASNYANAAYANALTATEDQMRQFKVDHQELLNDYQLFENKLKNNDVTLSDYTLHDNIEAVVSELKAKQMIDQVTAKKLDLLIKENRWYEVKTILNPIVHTISTSVQTGINAGEAVGVIVK